MEYTQQYEYAKGMISSFIVGEIRLMKSMDTEISSSMLNNLFTFNPTVLSYPSTIEKLTRSLDNKDSSFLIRLRAMATEVTTALGKEFVDELIENIKYGLLLACEPVEQTNHNKAIKRTTEQMNIQNIFDKWPWFWIIVVGSQVYRITVTGK